MTYRSIALLAALLSGLLVLAGEAFAAPVLMISIDGLRPGDVLEASSRGMSLPTLSGLAREGAHASGVRNVLPTVTYPNHTTLVTGVRPDRHGIASNTTFDPLRRNLEGWYWYASDRRAPTLWDAAHAAGRSTASLGWPVTVSDAAIDANLPEYWRAHTREDEKLQSALTTPGLEAALRASGAPVANTGDTSVASDAVKAQTAAALYRLRRPYFFTVHLSALDDVEHESGPGSAAARAALEAIDADVAVIVAAARQAWPDVTIAIVSDHGFAPVEHDLSLDTAFVRAGLMTLHADGQPASWEAAAWPSGGSAAVVLARPDDPALRARVAKLLADLAADPASGVGRIADRQAIASMGGAKDADFWVDAKIGYNMGSRLLGPLVGPPTEKGTHGYFPDHPEMRATLILAGPTLTRHGNLGEVDMRDIAPTLARIMGVQLPTAEGKPLF